MKPGYFDLSVRDVASARRFFEAALGWRFERYDGMPYVDAALARVREAGGRVVELRRPIPGIGWYATCAEPGGLGFGLIQEDAGAR